MVATWAVKSGDEYLHTFNVGVKWLNGQCYGATNGPRWVDDQSLAHRFVDRNAAARTAADLGARVVKLTGATK